MIPKSTCLFILLAACLMGFTLPPGGLDEARAEKEQTLYFRRVGPLRILDPEPGEQAVKDNIASLIYFWGDYVAERPFILDRLSMELHLDGTVVNPSANSTIVVALTRKGSTVYSEEVFSAPLPAGERPIDIVTGQTIYPGITFNRGDELSFYFQQKQNLNPLDFRYNGAGGRDDSRLILELGDVDYPYVQIEPAGIDLSAEPGDSADAVFEITNWGFDRLHYDLELPQGQQILGYGDMEDPDRTWAISGESNNDYYNVRFTAAQTCTLTSARMLFSTDGTVGQPDLVVYVWDDSSGFPGTKLDSVVIPNASVSFSPSWQLVYFSSGGLRMRPHEDFHIGYTVTGENLADALAIVSDDGEPVGDERRSSGRWGQNWGTMYDRHNLDANFFIRAVVTCGDPPAWLDYDSPPGSLAPYATHQIEVRLSAADLGSGLYQSGLIIENDSPDPAIVLPVTFRVGQTAVEQEEEETLPGDHALLGSYPNPFNAETRIRYRVGEAEGEWPFVRLVVYNTLGQRVRRLITGDRPPGVHEAQWDGRDDTGRPAAGGLYLCRLEIGEIRDAIKLVLLR
jgi:hypothetical protein